MENTQEILKKAYAILEKLKCCKPDSFAKIIDFYIRNIIITDDLKAGQGGLYCYPPYTKYNNLTIKVSSADTEAFQRFVFIHEAFHIPLLLVGYSGDMTRDVYLDIENKIDEAAQSFGERHPLITDVYFKILLQTV